MDQLFTPAALAVIDKLGTVTVLILISLLVITGKLLWHKSVEKALQRSEDRADRWEKIAIEALTSGAEAGVAAAQVAVGVVSAIPDPARDSTGKV